MNNHPPLSLSASIAASQDWWRDAGVDMAFTDEPNRWIADDDVPEQIAPVLSSPESARTDEPEVRIGGDESGWPQRLEDFASWWLNEETLCEGGSTPRLPPRGNRGAKVMFVVPMPEAGDTDTLLSGAQGRLLNSFAAAMGVTADDIFLATALPRHMAVPDWNRYDSQGLGKVLAHLVKLASPQRVIVMGSNILPLVGHDPAQGTPSIGQLSIQDRELPLLASYAPGRLLDHPRLRASLWKRWLEWTDGETR